MKVYIAIEKTTGKFFDTKYFTIEDRLQRDFIYLRPDILEKRIKDFYEDRKENPEVFWEEGRDWTPKVVEYTLIC